MDNDVPAAVETVGTHQIGVSRAPLPVTDLPEPEQVFGVSHLGRKEILKLVVGPSFIALGASIGSGEWLLGPLAVGQFGFVGIGWVITLSAVLQTFFNYETSRYIMATGEVPIVGFGRVPPGSRFWVPVSLFIVFFAFIWGGWAKGAAEALFALLTGNIATDADEGTVVLLAALLLVVVLVITLVSRKVTRGLELASFTVIAIQLGVLVLLCIVLVPPSVWWEGIRGLITPALPPSGTDATELGGLAGFTAMAAGLNWFLLNHYRDKGYGMGHRVGFIAGLRGGSSSVLASGVTFPDDERNTALWKRWTGFLKLDMWVIFLGGALVGMFLPTILMRHLVLRTGQTPDQDTIVTFAGSVLGDEYGRWLFYVVLFVGFLILFSTQLAIFEGLVRNMTDAVNMNPRMQERIGGDPRRFYYPFMILLIIVIGLLLQFFQPARLILISANMSNLGALIFPFVLIYLTRQLPRTARPQWWQTAALLLNVVFFGFFFVNFVTNEFFGGPLVTF
jgi:hypothetical protein